MKALQQSRYLPRVCEGSTTVNGTSGQSQSIATVQFWGKKIHHVFFFNFLGRAFHIQHSVLVMVLLSTFKSTRINAKLIKAHMLDDV